MPPRNDRESDMDRDASPLTGQDELLPPSSPKWAQTVGLSGLGLCAAAAVVGLAVSGMDPPPSLTFTLRLWLVLIGAVTAGAGVSISPDRWQLWAIGFFAAVFARFGIPEHWDSIRMLVSVIAAVAV